MILIWHRINHSVKRRRQARHQTYHHYYLNISVQAANLSDWRIESNRKNRFGSENLIESNRNFFARIGMLYDALYVCTICDAKKSHLASIKCKKPLGRPGIRPDPDGGAYSAPPDLLTDGEGAVRCPLLKNLTPAFVLSGLTCPHPLIFKPPPN